MEKSIINVEDVRFSYITAEGVAPIVLDGVTLDIEEGSFVAVLGHNGSGKSTLAKHMNAILLPTGGKVYVDGMDTADEDKLLDIRRTVGMVFQNPDNQIVANVVEEDVAFAPENLGVPPETSTGSTPPTSSPAARSSASPSPGSSPWSPGASSWTSPPPCWTPSAGPTCCAPSRP